MIVFYSSAHKKNITHASVFKVYHEYLRMRNFYADFLQSLNYAMGLRDFQVFINRNFLKVIWYCGYFACLLVTRNQFSPIANILIQ